MGKFRKKPVVIEAVQYTGDNHDEVNSFIGLVDNPAHAKHGYSKDELCIKTLEGVMTASPGDWVIKGVKNEFYPCRDDIFRATYEAVNEVQS